MSEEDIPSYKQGDIVWVKIGGCFWPGEITEDVPDDYTPKKPPLAIVKFFNEDSYEFVRSFSHIYSYNCARKNEFIRKGMDSYRGDNPHMKKFPGDVSLAEIRTDGNPNIISDPAFAPQKKSNIIAEIFGSPQKKTPKDKQKSRKKTLSKLNITHRRFLGCDDYETFVYIQYPGKDSQDLSDEEEIIKLNTEPSKAINCSQCSFSTTRINVMLFHVQYHRHGEHASVKKSVKKKKKVKRTPVLKHITSENSEFGEDSAGETPKPKRSRKAKGGAVTTESKKEESEKKTVRDIREHLLAEWSESDEEKPLEKEPESKKDCFDFDEDLEVEESSIIHTASGRKIPRVIPPSQRKSIEASLPLAEEDENRVELIRQEEEDEFKELMESTTVPDLPELPQKPSPLATKLTSPKKRFVKSFEDFESEQRKREEEEKKEDSEEKNEVKVEDEALPPVEISKLKCQIMSKMGEDDEDVVKRTHKSPRSKILETYRKEEEEKKEEEMVIEESEERPVIETEKVQKLEEAVSSPEPVVTDVEVEKSEELVTPPPLKEDGTESLDLSVKSMETEQLEGGEEDMILEEEPDVAPKFLEGEETPVVEEVTPFVPPSPEKQADVLESTTIEEEIPAILPEVQDEEVALYPPLAPKDEEIALFLRDAKDDVVPATSPPPPPPKDDIRSPPSSSKEQVISLSPPSPKVEPAPLPPPEPELVPIDGNLTVVSEKDLTDAQVEITSEQQSNQKPVTLTNFSMDFTDDKKTPEPLDLEDHIPSQIVDKPKEKPVAIAPPNSKLLERLTKHPKSKFVIKSKTEAKIGAVQKIPAKASDEDFIDAFIIHKGRKEQGEEEEVPAKKMKFAPLLKRGKAKILQQTIITSDGEIIQPGTPGQSTQDDFDINSMPIVLSDQILTPENIDSMPIVLEGEKKVKKPAPPPMKIINKQQPKILMGQKLIKQPFPSGSSGKKFVIVSSSAPITPQSKYTVGKRQSLIKKLPEPTGNKIMVLTNNQGQQQKLLLTPAQQKMMGMQKIGKNIVKGQIVHNIQKLKETPSSSKPVMQTQIRKPKVQMKQKTILIKNQHGQTVRKIQGTDEAALEQQVAQQIEAIKAGTLQNRNKSLVKKYQKKPETVVPPLAPITPKEKEQRPLNQLVIQDAMGNQTTITEGQILALPSETVDGQPQSYVLVTLDESGNLTPLNNEALLSLDPNLGLGGELNTVQVEQSEVEKPVEVVEPKAVVPKPSTSEGKQLIVTGDPVAAHKFLETLSDGSTDLANIIANAEGSILIHADGQQILINTDSDNQMVVNVNPEETTEQNPVFSTPTTCKNQDVLAAALADTDIFQQEQKLQSQLSPSSGLYPMNVGNVLETSLTLNSPIMTPLEVPSTNSKKVAESEILGQLPKNVDLPITVTDPNITQQVSQQQMNNLELGEMASANFVYAEIQKPYNSMPLLTEEEDKKSEEKEDDDGFLEESEGLCTLGGEMCSSLSEPPPDMFDLSAVLSSHQIKKDDEKSEESTSQLDEDSCEIPMQPEIVASFEEVERRELDNGGMTDCK